MIDVRSRGAIPRSEKKENASERSRVISKAIVVQRVETNGPGEITVTAAFIGNGSAKVNSAAAFELNEQDKVNLAAAFDLNGPGKVTLAPTFKSNDPGKVTLEIQSG